MAMCYVMDFADGSAEDYDWVCERMSYVSDGMLPPGALFHGAGRTDEGFRVVDVWESAEAFDRFAQAEIVPLTQQRGMNPPEMRAFETHRSFEGEQADATFLQIVTISGVDLAAFDALDAQVRPGGSIPSGLVNHVNGAIDGGVCVVDYWTDKATRDRFMEQDVAPAMQAAGITTMPQIEDLELHASLRPAMAHH